MNDVIPVELVRSREETVGGTETHPRLIERHLRVHAELEHVKQHLHVTLGLHEAAHDAEAAQQRTCSRHRMI